jgi:3-hydroxyisobutyrate dehydrogenase-like beta-hydroxyacid dehydrogenase
MDSVAVVGVGDMGSEMIPHLLAARFDVTAYDVNRARLQAAVDQGARRSDSPAAAAREADVVAEAGQGSTKLKWCCQLSERSRKWVSSV